MAVVNPLGDQKDNYELELSRVREKIKTKFAELIDCLKVRENELLRELDNILASYVSYRSELEKVSEKRIEIETMETALKGISIQSAKGIQEVMLKQLNSELNSIKIPIEPKMISFECDSNKMLAELNKLGKLVEEVRIEIDYKSKTQPLVSASQGGKGLDHLNEPLGVTVDNETGNIYIADQSDNCVKVFDSTGRYLFKFGDSEVEGKMLCPRGVAISGDRVIISQSNHCILNYKLNGMFVSWIGSAGKGELRFDYPFGLTIGESNGDIYICDRYNNRIQVLNEDFSFKSQFGKDTLKHPLDVKLSKKYIYVLDESNPCLHLFNYDYILQKSVISRGKRMEIVNPYFLFVDKNDDILITDSSSNSIDIFCPQFKKIHRIFTSTNPMGITVDKYGRVIIVCQAEKNCLQIF